MPPARPRHSVLSLFDPLSGSPDSSSEDKENVGDSSFFFPPSLRKAVQHSSKPTFKRRLIDVGDITVDDIDETDIHNLMSDDDNEDIEDFGSNIANDDEDDTLTFADMAKAATPKWAGRHLTKLTTPRPLNSPKSIQTPPRTPLTELFIKEEVTPMARKMPLKRQIAPVTSSPTEKDMPMSPPISEFPTSYSLVVSKSIKNRPATAVTPPRINVSLEEVAGEEKTELMRESLGSSVCTLNLPLPTGTLISDISIPISVSPSSPRSSLGVSLSPSDLPSTSMLRPNLHSMDNSNRFSIDLQSSFQIHLNSSDATFDLLNEKISFFDIKNGTNSFIGEVDDSFEDDDFAPPVPIVAKEVHRKKTPGFSEASPEEQSEFRIYSETRSSLANLSKTTFASELPIKTPGLDLSGRRDVHTRKTSTASSTPSTRIGSYSREIEDLDAKPLPVPSLGEKETSILATPSSSVPQCAPPAVPALKIVKRSKLLTRPNPTTKPTTISSRRMSNISDVSLPSRVTSPTSPLVAAFASASETDASQSTKGSKRVLPSQSHLNTLIADGNGPRRILVSEVPKPPSSSNSRTTAQLEHTRSSSTSTTNGPRRVGIRASAVEKGSSAVARPSAQASNGLKQPLKYATIGAASSIPKPVTRSTGSKLLAPSGIQPRFGAPSGVGGMSKGLPGRRVI